MAIANGVENIQWLLLLTMLVLFAITPLFGWVTSRFKTRQFLSYCTLFFTSHLVLFFFLFDVEHRSPIVTRAFYVWVNVFNMFIVSLFWSFMNDIYNQTQAKRLFAFIAAGGTAGALTGPIITSTLVQQLGLAPLLLISAGVLASSVLGMKWLSNWENQDLKTPHHAIEDNTQRLKGGAWDGLLLILKSPYLAGICLFIALYAISITFVQIQQAELVEQNYHDPNQRTQLFSQIDFAANALTLIFQLFLTSRLIQWLGYRTTLLIIPVGITLGFGLMAATPMLAVMVGVEIFRRSGDYAIMKPAREMLFSVVNREEKYKAKNFIDTTILRTGSTTSAWLYNGVKMLGASGAGVAAISVTLGIAWCTISYWLGNQYLKKSPNTSNENLPPTAKQES